MAVGLAVRPPGELGLLARRWFALMRRWGADVRELMHDGYATVCVRDIVERLRATRPPPAHA